MLFVVAAVGGGGSVPVDATWEYHTANHEQGSVLNFGPGEIIFAMIYYSRLKIEKKKFSVFFASTQWTEHTGKRKQIKPLRERDVGNDVTVLLCTML